jgi:hypothetical protein
VFTERLERALEAEARQKVSCQKKHHTPINMHISLWPNVVCPICSGGCTKLHLKGGNKTKLKSRIFVLLIIDQFTPKIFFSQNAFVYGKCALDFSFGVDLVIYLLMFLWFSSVFPTHIHIGVFFELSALEC